MTEAEAGAGTALPAPPVFDGVEFLEFAIDEETGDRLADLLLTLGFHHAGRHRSKAVQLYRQGRINLVLNSEQDSAAAEHFQLHGPAVCAVALRVDDVPRALARARMLLCPQWTERVGEGERRIPALRAPDGTLIYLVGFDASDRSLYEDDFHLFPSRAPGAGLTAIDHVAQALPYGRMDSFVLFYRAVLGLGPERLWEIPDPYGLVQSRAMVSADRTLRLPLNISESRETVTGRFVSAFAGAGVHHVAFAAEDIERTVAALRTMGAELLPIPANYYDDLAARHALDDRRTTRLRELDLLYDRDEAGEFIHAYTGTFEGRFFFEILERRGYQQFGAPNATVRMAAQAQHRSGRLSARLSEL